MVFRRRRKSKFSHSMKRSRGTSRFPAALSLRETKKTTSGKTYIRCNAHPEYTFELPALGQGVDGAVFTACFKDDCAFVGKVAKDLSQYDNEVAAFEKLNTDSGANVIAPFMYDHFECDNFIDNDAVHRRVGVIVMDNLDSTWDDELERITAGSKRMNADYQREVVDTLKTELTQYFDLLWQLHSRHNIAHRDAHTANVMKKNGRMYLVDFGRCHLKPGLEDIELDIEFAAYIAFQVLVDATNVIPPAEIQSWVEEEIDNLFDYIPFKKGVYDPRPDPFYIDWPLRRDPVFRLAPDGPSGFTTVSPPPGACIISSRSNKERDEDIPEPPEPGTMATWFAARDDFAPIPHPELDWLADDFWSEPFRLKQNMALVEGRSRRRGRRDQRKKRGRRRRGGHEVSRAKAREILHHGKVHGKPLTEKQRRYFGWLSSKGEMLALGDHEVIPGAAYDNEDVRMQVVMLLNARDKAKTVEAIRLLEQTLVPQMEPVQVTFDKCLDKEPAYYYQPYRTGSANAHHIRLCDDILGRDFARDYPTSNTIDHDPQEVAHYTVIVLHEFGHVLDKNELLDDIVPDLPSPAGYGERDEPNNASNEERADLFAQWFLSGAHPDTLVEDALIGSEWIQGKRDRDDDDKGKEEEEDSFEVVKQTKLDERAQQMAFVDRWFLYLPPETQQLIRDAEDPYAETVYRLSLWIQQLPKEVLYNIIARISHWDLYNLCTSSYAFSVWCEEHHLWQVHFSAQYGKETWAKLVQWLEPVLYGQDVNEMRASIAHLMAQTWLSDQSEYAEPDYPLVQAVHVRYTGTYAEFTAGYIHGQIVIEYLLKRPQGYRPFMVRIPDDLYLLLKDAWNKAGFTIDTSTGKSLGYIKVDTFDIRRRTIQWKREHGNQFFPPDHEVYEKLVRGFYLMMQMGWKFRISNTNETRRVIGNELIEKPGDKRLRNDKGKEEEEDLFSSDDEQELEPSAKQSRFSSDEEAREWMQRALQTTRGDPSVPMKNRPDLLRSIWILILSNNPQLSVQDIQRMCRVNHEFNALCASGEIWDAILRRQFKLTEEQWQQAQEELPLGIIPGISPGRHALYRLLAWRTTTYDEANDTYFVSMITSNRQRYWYRLYVSRVFADTQRRIRAYLAKNRTAGHTTIYDLKGLFFTFVETFAQKKRIELDWIRTIDTYHVSLSETFQDMRQFAHVMSYWGWANGFQLVEDRNIWVGDRLPGFKGPAHTEYTVEVRAKEPGDLYYGQGSPNGYALTCFEKCPRPRALRLEHGYVYTLKPHYPDVDKDHPMALSSLPKGGREDAREQRYILRKARDSDGALVIDTRTLSWNEQYHLICQHHEWMGFPIDIWIAEKEPIGLSLTTFQSTKGVEKRVSQLFQKLARAKNGNSEKWEAELNTLYVDVKKEYKKAWQTCEAKQRQCDKPRVWGVMYYFIEYVLQDVENNVPLRSEQVYWEAARQRFAKEPQ